MTELDFVFECNDRFIDPDVAIENDIIKKALSSRDDATVLELLEQEFLNDKAHAQHWIERQKHKTTKSFNNRSIQNR